MPTPDPHHPAQQAVEQLLELIMAKEPELKALLGMNEANSRKGDSGNPAPGELEIRVYTDGGVSIKVKDPTSAGSSVAFNPDGRNALSPAVRAALILTAVVIKKANEIRRQH